MSWIESRRCDIAFLPNIPAGDDKLFSIPLQPDRLVVFVSQEHVWAERRSVSLEELVSQRIVLREQGSRTRSIFEEAIHDAGLALDNVMEISGREGVREAVAAGFGVGIVAENELLADSRLRALPVSNAELVHAEYVVCLQEMRSLRVNDAFLEMIRPSQKEIA
jgi:DNA-binding transcriptional LysR family regulator